MKSIEQISEQFEKAIQTASTMKGVVHIMAEPGMGTMKALDTMNISSQDYYVSDRTDAAYMDTALFEALETVSKEERYEHVIVVVSKVGFEDEYEKDIAKFIEMMRTYVPVVEVENL